jgi:4-amino-4-deoxy-L-arabinose transferase-like glycosyltransferase
MNRWRYLALGLAILTLGVNLALVVPPIRYGAAFTLLWLLPGLVWARLLGGRHRRPAVEEIVTGLGLGVGSVALLTLLVYYLPGPLTLPALLGIVNLFIFFLLFLALRAPSRSSVPAVNQRSSSGVRSLSFILHSSLIILLAGSLRLTYLDYSEFQGDEGTVMMRAARAIQGDDAQLFYHQKGPVEVLLPMAMWALSGTINEWQARLPFAFAGILGVAAFYLLGRRWFDERSGFIGASLLAINGYFVGFGRIVQYQGFVLAAVTLALLALWRWSQEGERRWLLAGSALLAFGLLAHYDAGLVLPAAIYIVGQRLWANRSQRHTRIPIRDLLGASALALGILALFYFPFMRHPNFAKTLTYLSSARIGTQGPLYNNILSSLPLATFYNSSYYLIGLACLIVLASFLSFQRIGLLIPIACHFLVLLLSILGSTPGSGLALWVGPVMAVLLLAIVLSRRTTTQFRAAWLWFGAPFIFYYFLVWDPRTHVLNAFPGAILLAASALDHILDATSTRLSSLHRRSLVIIHRSLFIACCLLFILLGCYPYLMFVKHDPEIKRSWPTHRPTLYWKPAGDDGPPQFGFFGFPYRAGWKVVNRLVEEGVIEGVYASNEEPQVTSWYTRGAVRTYCPAPDWYLIAQGVQDQVPILWEEIGTSYYLWGEILVGGESKLKLYRRGLPSLVAPVVFHAELKGHASRFDARTTPAAATLAPRADYMPAGHTLDEAVRLLGYKLDATDAHPGGSIDLVLYWEALQPMETNYQVFNHLYDSRMWGQQDGTPGCGLQPTVFWEPGHIVRDEHTISIAPTAPAGDIPLLVGMYDLITQERLPIRDPKGLLIGNVIPLAMVTVE